MSFVKVLFSFLTAAQHFTKPYQTIWNPFQSGVGLVMIWSITSVSLVTGFDWKVNEMAMAVAIMIMMKSWKHLNVVRKKYSQNFWNHFEFQCKVARISEPTLLPAPASRPFGPGASRWDRSMGSKFCTRMDFTEPSCLVCKAWAKWIKMGQCKVKLLSYSNVSLSTSTNDRSASAPMRFEVGASSLSIAEWLHPTVVATPVTVRAT